MACQRIEQGAVARAPELDRIVVDRGDHGRAGRGVDIAGVVLEPGDTQDKGAASTDLTAESGAAPAQTLAADWPEPTVSKSTAEQDEAEHTDREALALAQLYALYLSAHRSHNTHSYSYSHGSGYGYGYTRSYD